jgi:tripeptide aminopeptidase
MDGSSRGEVEMETFSADAITVTFHGFNTHAGYAKGRMINAIKLAAAFLESLPRGTMSPETTEGYEGFVHPYVLQPASTARRSSCWCATSSPRRSRTRKRSSSGSRAKSWPRHPGARVEVTVEEQYRNMKGSSRPSSTVVEHAREAIRRAGLEPRTRPIRGGHRWLPAVVHGTADAEHLRREHNFHSRLEWVSVQDMEKAVEVIVHLCRVWEESA